MEAKKAGDPMSGAAGNANWSLGHGGFVLRSDHARVNTGKHTKTQGRPAPCDAPLLCPLTLLVEKMVLEWVPAQQALLC